MEYKKYSSYNALDRVPIFMGIPIVLLLLLLVLGIILFAIGMSLFGIIGFLFPILLLPVYLYLKQITAKDDQAIRIVLIEMYFRGKRKSYKEFGNTLTFLSSKYLRNDKTIKQAFEEDIFSNR